MSDKNKGFASMDKDKVKDIAAKGGKASHKNDHNKDANDNRAADHSSSRS